MVPMLTSVLIALLLGTGAAQTGTLTLKPAAWTNRAPASSMRVAEFVVPKAPGDSEDGEVIIYYFAGGGGSVEANLQRWASQFQSTKSSLETATVNGLKLASVDVSGTYVAEMRPGSSEHYNKPGFRTRATFVETPKGPVTHQTEGPAKTVDSAGATFDEFLHSLAFK